MIVTKALGSASATASATLRAGLQVTLRRGPPIALSLVTAGDVSADGWIVVLRSYTPPGCSGSGTVASG